MVSIRCDRSSFSSTFTRFGFCSPSEWMEWSEWSETLGTDQQFVYLRTRPLHSSCGQKSHPPTLNLTD